MLFRSKCGTELDDDTEFCTECGHDLNESPTKSKKPTEFVETKNREFIKKAPLIITIIAIVTGIAESLSTPLLFGWDPICFALGISILGGTIGAILIEKLDEPLIGAVEFILTSAIIFTLIGKFGEISAIIFIIAAIVTLYLKGLKYKKMKLISIPIITVILLFVILITGGAISYINAEDSISVGNITQSVTYSGYGYYDGNIDGDIRINSNFDYLSVKIDYYDEHGRIIDSAIGWNKINPDNGKTYKFSGNYFNKEKPVKAEISVVDSSKQNSPLYSENITLLTSSGV